MAIVLLSSSARRLPQISIIWLNNLSVWITSMIPETSVPTAGLGVRRGVEATFVLKRVFSGMRGEGWPTTLWGPNGETTSDYPPQAPRQEANPLITETPLSCQGLR